LLEEIGKVLKHDFFQYYSKNKASEDMTKPATKKDIQKVLKAITDLSRK
jgi:hypothetical protein